MALETRRQYQLVDPTTEATTASFTGAPRLRTLAGKKIGLIDDSKKNAKELLEEISGVLKERFEISVVKYHRKPSASKPAEPDAIAEMARECDCVIVAIGD